MPIDDYSARLASPALVFPNAWSRTVGSHLMAMSKLGQAKNVHHPKKLYKSQKLQQMTHEGVGGGVLIYFNLFLIFGAICVRFVVFF